jgi:predicted 3-demethylubiquinone-9 3-methyltransferase (glyoxalase superfamily)
MQKFITFFMFDGWAEEAMNFYVTLFNNSSILSLTQYGVEGPGTAGSVMHATFSLNGQEFMCIDSAVKHFFSFTPSISVYVNCEDDEEIEKVFAAFADGGKIMMPLDNYGFSKKFGWVADRFGVSWQLNLA